MYKELLTKINEYKQITIFRHARPDGDCVFSSLAFYIFLKDNFKDSKIKLAGFEKYNVISKIEKVSDKFINDSLAIVLDTATRQRCDDIRFLNAKYIIKIDHHPITDDYGNYSIVKPEASATCEILANIFFSKEFNKFKFSNKVYRFLYCGLLTDTINFRTTNTTQLTLKTAAKLVELGRFKPSDCSDFVMNDSLETYKKVSKIRNYLSVENNFGYIKLNKKQLKQIGIGPIEAKDNIDQIGSIKELNIWAFAVEVDGKYDASLRSKRGYIINKIASKYNGGGHDHAAGVKQLDESQLDELFKELIELSINM